MRQQWYLDSKASWNWLSENNVNTYFSFAATLEPGANLGAIASLVGTVFAPYHSQGREVFEDSQ